MSISTTYMSAGRRSMTALKRGTTNITKSISSWFTTETLEVSFGDSTGRPGATYQFDLSQLSAFLSSGWRVQKVATPTEDGNWESKTKTSSVSSSETKGNTASSSTSYSSQTTGTSSLSSSSIGSSNSITNTHGTSSQEGLSANETSYWETTRVITLSRTRVNPKAVLTSMISVAQESYSEGKQIEDIRYNDIVSYYLATVADTARRGNGVLSEATNLMPLARRVVDSIFSSMSSAESAAEEVSEKSTANRQKEVNRQFDALVSQSKAKMIADGTYNGTVWPSVLAGIERQRSEALDKAAEASSSVKVSAHQAIASAKGSAFASVLSVMQSIVTAADQRKVTVIEMQNNVVKWMLDYAGAAGAPTYSGPESIANIIDRFGFASVASGAGIS